MTLTGWTHPLPDWLAAAVVAGQLQILTLPKGEQVLSGSIVSPWGCTYNF